MRFVGMCYIPVYPTCFLTLMIKIALKGSKQAYKEFFKIDIIHNRTQVHVYIISFYSLGSLRSTKRGCEEGS